MRLGLEIRSQFLQFIPMNTEFAPIFKLGRAERLQLVEDIWDSLVAEGNPDPISDSKRNELRHRKEQYAQNPTSGIAWTDVKQRARFLQA